MRWCGDDRYYTVISRFSDRLKSDIIVSDTTTKETIANSVSGVVSITSEKGKISNVAIPNVVVRALQWQPKQNSPKLTNADLQMKDHAAFNAKFGSWKLVDTTVTNSNGYYAFKGTITPGYKTLIEVLSISRPGNKLPTTYVIANKEAAKDAGDDNQLNHYGKIEIDEQCPSGVRCATCNCYIGEAETGTKCDKYYAYMAPRMLTKDDRIIYGFRKTLTFSDETSEEKSSIPRGLLSEKCHTYGVHDGKNNPTVNFMLNDQTMAAITAENWYELPSSPSYLEDYKQVGICILDIIRFITNIILPKCTNKSGLILDLHYYPAIDDLWERKYNIANSDTSYESDDSDDSYDSYDSDDPHYAAYLCGRIDGIDSEEVMPDRIEQYGTSNHYHAALPPVLHLTYSPGLCYPYQLKKLLLQSGLFRNATKSELDVMRYLESKLDDMDVNTQNRMLSRNCQ